MWDGLTAVKQPLARPSWMGATGIDSTPQAPAVGRRLPEVLLVGERGPEMTRLTLVHAIDHTTASEPRLKHVPDVVELSEQNV